jgi:hypothetical protein
MWSKESLFRIRDRGDDLKMKDKKMALNSLQGSTREGVNR